MVTESADQLFATDLICHYPQLGDVHMAAAGGSGSVMVLQLSSSDQRFTDRGHSQALILFT